MTSKATCPESCSGNIPSFQFRSSWRPAIVAGAVGLLLLVSSAASAQSQWTGAQGLDWFDPGNWNPQQVPVSGNVDIDTSTPNWTLVSGQATGALDFLRIGVLDVGDLLITQGGSTSSVDAFLGIEATGSGRVTVQGSGSEWNLSSRIRIGNRGEGFVWIHDGARLIGDTSTVGLFPDSFGSVTVRGQGSEWISESQLVIGWSGSGILLADDAALISSGNAWIGQDADGIGLVFLGETDSRWASDDTLTVGQGGATGAFWVYEGAALETGTTRLGVLGGIGFITLEDVGSRWDNGGNIEIGPSGTGTVIVEAGSSLVAGGEVLVGGSDFADGLLLVDGNLQAAGGVVVGKDGVLRGEGTLNASVTVEDGGSIDLGNDQAGTLSVGSLSLDPGAELVFELNSPNTVGLGVNDLVSVSGDLVLDGRIDVIDLGGFAAGTYTALTYTGNLTDNGLTVGSLPFGFQAEVDTSTPGQVRLIVTSELVFRDRFEGQDIPVVDMVEPLPRIEFVSDRTIFFSSTGQQSDLLVQVLDANGEELPDATVTWISSDPSAVAIEATGPLSAQVTRLGNFDGTITVTAFHDDSLLEAQAFIVHAVLSNETIYLPSLLQSRSGTGSRMLEPLVLDIQGDRFSVHDIVLRRTPETAAIGAGDILLSGDLAGIMVEVLSVSVNPNSVSVQVQPATFTQAFEELDFDAEQDFLEVGFDSLGDDTLMTVRSLPDGRLIESRVLHNLNLLDRLTCEGDLDKDQEIDVSRLSFNSALKASLKLKIVNRQLETLFFDISGELKAFAGAKLEIDTTLLAQAQCSVALPDIRSPSFPMGPLSFEVILNPQIFLGAAAAAQGKIEASTPTLEMALTGNARLEYVPGSGWQTSGGFGFEKQSDPAFSLQASSSLGVAGSTGLRTNAQLNILLGRRFLLSARLLSAEFMEFTAALNGSFSFPMPSPIIPSSPEYGGPTSQLGYLIDVTGQLKVDLLNNSLGRFLDLSMSLDGEWTIFNLEGSFHESAEIFGSIQCSQACTSIPNNGSAVVTVTINSNVEEGMPNTGMAEVWLRQEGSSELSFLSSTALNDGTAQIQISPGANFAPVNYGVHVRVRLDGPFNAYTAIWPLAPSSSAVGQFSVIQAVP